MAKRHLLMLGLLLGGVGTLAAGCSDRGIVGLGGDSDAGEAGEAGSTSDAGGSGHAGSGNGGSLNAGSGNGGSGHAGSGEAGSGEAGSGEAGSGEGGAAGDGGEYAPPLNPQGVVVVGATPATSAHVLVSASSFATSKGEVVSVTLGTGSVGDSATYDDGDVVATSSAGIGFAIERTNDKVHLLDNGKISTTFNLKNPGTDKAPISNKAYVPLYNQSSIVILDLAKGKVSRRLDLTDYNAAGDQDLSADISEGVYDPTSKIAYFLLQRIDITSYDASLHLPCSSSPGLIVGIDTETDNLVDLNGAAEGKAIELALVNPRSLSISSDGKTIHVLADGCYEGNDKTHRGVEILDLTKAGKSTVAYTAAGSDYLASMILTGSTTALIESQDASYATHWNKLDLSTGTLGAELSDVPEAVSFDGTDLLGVQVTGPVGAVVRYSLTTETSTVVSPTSWVGNYSYVSATALVK